MTKIIILGCGIIGLYTTYLLLERGYAPEDITIIAKHIPGDMSHDYASPYAGATINTCKSADKNIQFFYKFTFNKLKEIREVLGGSSCGIGDVYNFESWDVKPSEEALEFFKSYNKTIREMEPSELPEGATFGLHYKTLVINSPLLIQNLYDYVVAKNVKVVVKELKHIKEAILDDTKYLFNCCGLGSASLGGVEDKASHPTRAQVVVIKAPHIKEVRLFWGDTANYCIKRPCSDEAVLGGFYQKRNYNRDILGSETKDLLQRATKYFPILKPGQTIDDLEIMRVVSAHRPGRDGGVRIEKDIINGTTIIHNYGAEGNGYAQGGGMAEKAIRLADPLKL